jgi:hypothetical protein
MKSGETSRIWHTYYAAPLTSVRCSVILRYPCQHAEVVCYNLFNWKELVHSVKEVSWFSRRFSIRSPKGRRLPS